MKQMTKCFSQSQRNISMALISNNDIKLSTLQSSGPICAILPLMKQYDFISPLGIERLAFRANFNRLTLDASGFRLLGAQRYYQEAARYLITIKSAMHRIERSNIKSGLQHVEEKVRDENESVGFRQGVADARSMMVGSV